MEGGVMEGFEKERWMDGWMDGGVGELINSGI